MSASLYAKQKLNNTHRLKVFNFACERFVEPELRAEEQKLYDDFWAAFCNDLYSIPQSEIDILEKHVAIVEYTSVCLPFRHHYEVDKEHTLPDGSKIVRKTDKSFDLGSLKPLVLQDFSQVRRYAQGKETWYTYHMARQTELPKPFRYVSAYFNGNFDFYDGLNYKIISAEVRAKFADYAFKNKERVEAEFKLLQSVAKLIIACKKWKDVLDFWPESVEIEFDLFGYSPLTTTALTVVNTDEINALCANMKRRGVTTGALCTLGS